MSDPFTGGFDPRMFEQVPLFRELAKVMSWTKGPVNWELARQTAEALTSSTLSTGIEATASASGTDFEAAVGVAELWLDPITSLPRVDGPVQSLSPTEWVRLATTHEGLGRYVEPIAEGMGAAMSQAMGEMGEQLKAMVPQGGANPFAQMMGAVGAMLYGLQVGTISGNLAGQLLGCYDLGVPITAAKLVGTVGATATAFASDYAIDPMQLHHWLALRETAHRRMFVGVAWLEPRVTELIRRFAAEADFDPESLMGPMGLASLDPNDPQAIQSALESPDAFRLEPSTAQRRVLNELQALVSFIEAYGDTIVRFAAAQRLPDLPRVEEALRRRRAEKGPGERFLQQLVGLDLEPAHVRQAQAFCDAVLSARGQEGLERVWTRPQHLPTVEELADPSRWLVRMAAVELDGPDVNEA